MSVRTRTWLAWTTVALLAGACGDDKKSNDEQDPTVDAGKRDAAPDTSEDAGLTCGARADGTPLDTSKTGGCYYFWCNETEESVLAQATKGGACAGPKDVAIQCEGQSPRTVAECARNNAGKLEDIKVYEKAVLDCARADERLSKDFSDACLSCNVKSAVCAAEKCLGDCVMGDSPECDKCRIANKCEAQFYKCGGLPDPH